MGIVVPEEASGGTLSTGACAEPASIADINTVGRRSSQF
jgi:hypothetical protein